jgi:hypothetical protein
MRLLRLQNEGFWVLSAWCYKISCSRWPETWEGAPRVARSFLGWVHRRTFAPSASNASARIGTSNATRYVPQHFKLAPRSGHTEAEKQASSLSVLPSSLTVAHSDHSRVPNPENQ